jgi:hypothetical protein
MKESSSLGLSSASLVEAAASGLGASYFFGFSPKFQVVFSYFSAFLMLSAVPTTSSS